MPDNNPRTTPTIQHPALILEILESSPPSVRHVLKSYMDAIATAYGELAVLHQGMIADLQQLGDEMNEAVLSHGANPSAKQAKASADQALALAAIMKRGAA